MLGDSILAEPKAVIGVEKRRVLEQLLQDHLADDFQTTQYLLTHIGMQLGLSTLKDCSQSILMDVTKAAGNRRATAVVISRFSATSRHSKCLAAGMGPRRHA